MYMTLTTFLGLKSLVLSFLNFLSSRALLSYKPISYDKRIMQQITESTSVFVEFLIS